MRIPMDVAPAEQCIAFLLAIAVGAVIGLLYRLLRLPGRRHAAFLWDSLFVMLSLALGTGFFLTVCRGYPRSFHLLGFAIGAAIVVYLPRRVAAVYKRRKNEKEKVTHHT
jgi:membrane associated rhomboid family serine protease